MDANSNTVTYQIVDNLVGVDPGTSELVPALATEWSANEDSTVWTFTLREGVTFQDGTPFDAEAVVFNFRRWNEPDFEHGYREEGKTYVPWTWSFGGFAGSEEARFQEARAVDDHTVELVLAEPIGFLPAMLSSSYLGMHSPEAIRTAGPDYGTPAAGVVGTGAFTFESWEVGSDVRLVRNDDYWGEPARVEELVFVASEEPVARLAELQAGTIDIALDLAPDDVATVEADPELEPAVPESGLNVGYMAFHQEHEPFGDVRVRQAVAHAIDVEAIVEAFYAGLGLPAEGLVPPPLWGRVELDTRYEYDPERARELLAEAGYGDGFQTELWYMPVSRPYFPAPQPIAETMASYLADVGIEAELLTEDWGTYLERYNQGAYPMYMLGWIAEFPDPDNFLNTLVGPGIGPTGLGWQDDEVFSALEEARGLSEQSERASLYEGVARTLNEQMVMLPVAHNRVLNATRANVEGFVPVPFGTHVFRTVSLGGE